MSKMLLRLKKLLLPVNIEGVELPTLGEQVVWLGRRTRILYHQLQLTTGATIHRVRRIINRAPAIAEQQFEAAASTILDQQRQIESSTTYTIYTIGRHVVMPFFIAPLPIAASQVVWNMAIWNSLSFIERRIHINDAGMKRVLQYLLQLLVQLARIHDKPLQMMANIATLVALRAHPRLSNEAKAVFYILAREGASSWFYYQKHSLISEYQEKLGTTVADPYTEAEKYFLIHKNVPLEQAEIVIFCERHNNQTHQDLQGLFASLMSSEEDVVLLEGLGSMKPCSSDIYYPNFDEHYNVTRPRFSRLQKCFGWDASEQVKKSWEKMLFHHAATKKAGEFLADVTKSMPGLIRQQEENNNEFNRIQKEQNDINDLIHLETENCKKALLNPQPISKEISTFLENFCQEQAWQKHSKQIALLNERRKVLSQKINAIIHANSPNLVGIKESQARMEAASSSEDLQDKTLIIERNKFMIKTLERVSFWSKAFVSTGSRHVLKDSKNDNPFAVASADPQSELRAYLDTRPHAILYPK